MRLTRKGAGGGGRKRLSLLLISCLLLVTVIVEINNNGDSRLGRLLLLQQYDQPLVAAVAPTSVASGNSPNSAGPQQQQQQKQEAARARLLELGQTPLLPNGDTPKPLDAWTLDLFARLDRIRASCGEICAINSLQALEKYTIVPPPEPNNNNNNNVNITLRQLQVPIDCEAIMMDEDVDVGDTHIPRNPPNELLPYYTLNGLISFTNKTWVNQTYLGTKAASKTAWTEEYFQPIIDKIDRNFGTEHAIATYGKQSNDFAVSLKKHIGDFTGKRVLVIGTEHPWVEALSLWMGASHVVTLEYGEIDSHQHPKVTTLLPSEFRTQYQAGTLGQFDVVLSFSSLEHPGLGRYGDALNPWGDVIAVARAYCVTKPGGYLGLSMPSREGDGVIFNECRTYGPVRWSLLTANWNQIDGEYQRTVLSKIRKRHKPYVFQKPF